MKKILSLVLAITLLFTMSCVSGSYAFAITSDSSLIDGSDYVTDSSQWETTEDGTYVSNLPDYSFFEDAYYTSSINGGSIVRQDDFVRGIGLSMYYSLSEDPYWRPQEIIDADNLNLKELRINSSRTWGGVSESEAASAYAAGKTYLPTYSATNYDKSVTINGDYNIGIKFSSNSDSAFNNILSSFNINTINGLEGVLLGNEYTNWSNSASSYGGYDDETQEEFKTWLAEKFTTIDNFNAKMNTDYADWSEIPKVVSSNSSTKPIWIEFYLFLQEKFEGLMQGAYNSAKTFAPNTDIGYAKIMGEHNSFADDADLSFLDFGGQNIYYTWDSDFDKFSYKLNNQISLYGSKPFYATETGIRNSYENSGDLYKQTLAMMYMHPQVAGSYAFVYSDSNDEWGLVKADRSAKTDNYYALKQIYNDFEYLDNYLTGASESPIVAITNGGIDKNISGTIVDKLNSILMSQGASTKVLQSKNTSSVENLDINRLIIADSVLYQTPDSSDDIATSATTYLNNAGNKILAMNGTGTASTTLYGNDDSYTSLQENSSYQTSLTTYDSENAWSEIATFIHKDFVEGNVELQDNTIDSNAVRILNANASNIDDVEQTLLYKNGRLYLAIVNTSTEAQNVDVTIGVNNGVRVNLHPEIIVADGNVTVTKPENAIVPNWVASNENITSNIAYGTVSISDLTTYAFIDLGMAIQNGSTEFETPDVAENTKDLFSFDDAPTVLSDYIQTSYNATVDYSTDFANDGESSLKITNTDKGNSVITVKSDIYSDFSGTGLSFWYNGKLDAVALKDESGNTLCNVPIYQSTNTGDTIFLDYSVLGIDDGTINEISSIEFLLAHSDSEIANYIDAIKVINPNELVILQEEAISNIESSDASMLDDFLKSTVNIPATATEEGILLSEPSHGYPAVELEFGYFCDEVEITLYNSGENNFVLASYNYADMYDTSKKTQLYTSLAVGSEYTIKLSDLYQNGIKSVYIVLNCCTDGDAATPKDIDMLIKNITVTGIRSERVVAAVEKIKNMNPFNAQRAERYYNSLSDTEKEYVYNSDDLNKYIPTMNGSSISMAENQYFGQMAYDISNPQLDADLNTNGYEVTEIGVLIIPTQLLTGELTYDNESAEIVSKEFAEEDKEGYLDYKAIFKNSTDYEFVKFTARAFVKYSNGVNTIICYDDDNFVRSLNMTYRLTANEYLQSYTNEKFNSDIDFTKAYSLSTVKAFVNEAFAALN